MKKNIYEDIQKWLEQRPEERDYQKGNEMLLKFTRNVILYNNLARTLPRFKARQMLEYQLQKFLKPVLAHITHEEVEEMQKQVDKITEFSEQAEKRKEEDNTIAAKVGKRIDHDKLPDFIQVLYVENLDLMRRIRQNKLELNQMILRNTTCPDGDRYPFLKEIIRLDKKMRENWRHYDEYELPERPRERQRKPNTIYLLISMYKRKPTAEMKARIQALFKNYVNPNEKLKALVESL